jgi:hypothetical protein
VENVRTPDPSKVLLIPTSQASAFGVYDRSAACTVIICPKAKLDVLIKKEDPMALKLAMMTAIAVTALAFAIGTGTANAHGGGGGFHSGFRGFHGSLGRDRRFVGRGFRFDPYYGYGGYYGPGCYVYDYTSYTPYGCYTGYSY